MKISKIEKRHTDQAVVLAEKVVKGNHAEAIECLLAASTPAATDDSRESGMVFAALIPLLSSDDLNIIVRATVPPEDAENERLKNERFKEEQLKNEREAAFDQADAYAWQTARAASRSF